VGRESQLNGYRATNQLPLKNRCEEGADTAEFTVTWTVQGGPPGTLNRVEWGTAPGSFPKSTLSDTSVPYQATFTAPTTPCVVYLKVHLIATGGLDCTSDVQRVRVE